jgi:hypothetical protein
MSDPKPDKSDHSWQDDALLPTGRAWQAGVRFVCANGCGIERRAMFDEGFHVMKGHATEKKSWIYFRGAKRVRGGEAECSAKP